MFSLDKSHQEWLSQAWKSLRWVILYPLFHHWLTRMIILLVCRPRTWTFRWINPCRQWCLRYPYWQTKCHLSWCPLSWKTFDCHWLKTAKWPEAAGGNDLRCRCCYWSISSRGVGKAWTWAWIVSGRWSKKGVEWKTYLCKTCGVSLVV